MYAWVYLRLSANRIDRPSGALVASELLAGNVEATDARFIVKREKVTR